MKDNYNVEMTLNQFLSLDNYINNVDIITEINNTKQFRNFHLKKRKDVDVDEIKNWMFNGWNTERVLRVSNQLFDSQDNHFVLQWSFPQSYYSVFQLTLSFIYLIRKTKISHKSIMDKFGELVKYNWYPKSISFYSDGTNKNPIFKNISNNKNINSIDFDPNSIESCERQIHQFLKSTRKIDLSVQWDDKNVKKKYRNRKGEEKKRLNEKEWGEISKSIGNTTILHLLYRKRIKSNYKNIDTFTSGENQSKKINESLIEIVNKLNFIHECFIYKTIGSKKFLEFYNEFKKNEKIPFLEERIELIKNTIT